MGIRKLDEDRLAAVLTAATWTSDWESKTELCNKVKWLQETLRSACNVGMPKTRSSDRAPTYWWTEEVAQLRRNVISANRILSRARRKGNAQRVAQAWVERREARRELKLAIKKAKPLLGRKPLKTWTEIHGEGHIERS